ncbi:MAG: AAA family ATPase [Lachnospiraceae bacterium]|nr:AAA family ATPase [Lachnospiraceae bacterium]
MNHIYPTLAKAYEIIESAGQPLSFEIGCISNMLISPARISSFKNDDLYLKYITNLVKERGNVSFPEKKEDYDHYFQDCISLKNQMMANQADFNESSWLNYTIFLLENLKTPYYDTYSSTLRSLERCFSNQELFEQTLQTFYSVMIRSLGEKLDFIKTIAGYGLAFKKEMKQNESLLAGILVQDLALFCNEKNFWLTSLIPLLYHTDVFSAEDINQKRFLDYFLQKELEFLQITEEKELSSYLSKRSIFFQEHRTEAPSDLFLHSGSNRNLKAQIIQSEFLNTYAYNMNARNYITNPAIGREQELSDLELILISPKKSPILIGEAGVGKTSVVEGLAYQLQRGQVPSLLKNKKIFKLTTTSLLSGTKYVGEMEERMKKLMDELKKQPDVILFIDEIHTIVGAGSTENSNNDISNMLKPYIDRGDIKIIGATTSQEYMQFLIPDKALSRRFYPIAIEEPDSSMTLQILKETLPSVEYETRVKNTFSAEKTNVILRTLIDLSTPENQPEDRRTRLPELPLTLMEMAFSYAALDSRTTVSQQDFAQAVRHTNLLKKEIRLKAEQYFI